MSTEVFASEYEAHYHLIEVWEADLYRWTARCGGEGCGWSRTEYSATGARDVALKHCEVNHTVST